MKSQRILVKSYSNPMKFQCFLREIPCQINLKPMKSSRFLVTSHKNHRKSHKNPTKITWNPMKSHKNHRKTLHFHPNTSTRIDLHLADFNAAKALTEGGALTLTGSMEPWSERNARVFHGFSLPMTDPWFSGRKMLTWLGYIDGIHVTIYSIHGSYGLWNMVISHDFMLQIASIRRCLDPKKTLQIQSQKVFGAVG